jgi:hypothetical protein
MEVESYFGGETRSDLIQELVSKWHLEAVR